MIKVRKRGKFAKGTAKRQGASQHKVRKIAHSTAKRQGAMARGVARLSGGSVRQPRSVSRRRTVSSLSRTWTKSSVYPGYQFNKNTGKYRVAS